MSPATRRRIRKRLYMRRKRAAKSGNAAVEDTARLKTGRKPKKDKKQVSTEPPPPPPPPVETEPGKRKKQNPETHVPGLTRWQRAQVEFEKVGVSEEQVKDNALGFFHLRELTRMMK